MSRPRRFTESVQRLGVVGRRFAPYLRREWRLLAGSLAALVVSVGLQIVEPWPLKFVLDRVLDKSGGADGSLNTQTQLALAALALVAVTALRAAAEYWSRIWLAIVGNRVLGKVRGELFAHVQSLSLGFHHRARGGDLVVRLIADVTQLREVAVTALLPLAGNLLILTGMTFVMFLLEWRLALAAVAIAPLFGLTTIRLSRRIHHTARKQRQRQGKMAATAAESIGAVKIVQALSLEDRFHREFAGDSGHDMKESVKGARLSASLERSVDVLVAVGSALVLWLGARFVLQGELSAGGLIVFLTYLKRAFRPVQDFAKYSARLSKAAAAGERVLELLERAPEVSDEPGAAPAPALSGRIRFDDVSFGYEPGQRVLDRFQLDIAAGKRVAIVGSSGAGKSTLLGLLLRLYDPQSGAVTADGLDIRRLQLASWRSQISVVMQDNVLFAADLWTNIGCGDEGRNAQRGGGASDELGEDEFRREIVAAARLAGAHEFISALPQGYDSILGERGVTLSHGQRQRVAIARAAMRRSPILLLDEPCAGLDRDNEELVQQALDRLAVGRTSILVTHDLTHASRADEIVYLEDGRVIEHGAHAELLAADGAYAAAYRLQSVGARDALRESRADAVAC